MRVPRATTMAACRPTRSAHSLRAFPGASAVEVEDRTGTGDHFQVTVVTADFDGVALLDQHRRVNEALAAPLADGSIHELRIKTKGTA